MCGKIDDNLVEKIVKALNAKEIPQVHARDATQENNPPFCSSAQVQWGGCTGKRKKAHKVTKPVHHSRANQICHH
jgi:hypothetical protein